jgi:hypothetical protein
MDPTRKLGFPEAIGRGLVEALSTPPHEIVTIGPKRATLGAAI